MTSVPPFAWIRSLAKIELHCHLETALRLRLLTAPRLHRDVERRTVASVADPANSTGYGRLRRLRYASRVASVADDVYTPGNIEQITADLLREAAHQQVRYAEIRVGGRRGFALLGMRRMFEAMAHARERAAATLGIDSRIIVSLVRERGPDEAAARVREAQTCQDCGVVGVDLAGDEENYPPSLFVRAMDIAREAGLGITVHAGEFAGPANIWTALSQLGARRIGHGIRAVEDQELMAYLREKQIPLEICPSSNLRLGLCSSLSGHPIRELLDARVLVTINTDDPVLLGTDLSREFYAIADALSLSQVQITRLVATSAQGVFLPAVERVRLAAGMAAGSAAR